MNNIKQIIMRVSKTNVIRMNTGASSVIFRTANQIKMSVVSFGKQGPVGTVAESVLTLANEAKAEASNALLIAQSVSSSQDDLVSGMTLSIDHHIGAISAI